MPATGRSDPVQVLGGKQAKKTRESMFRKMGGFRQSQTTHKGPGATAPRSPSRKLVPALGQLFHREQGSSMGLDLCPGLICPRGMETGTSVFLPYNDS